MDFLYVGMGNALNARIGQFFNQALNDLQNFFHECWKDITLTVTVVVTLKIWTQELNN